MSSDLLYSLGMVTKRKKSTGRSVIFIQLKDADDIKSFEWLLAQQVPRVTANLLGQTILGIVARKCQNEDDPYLWRE